jgi:hypothetical protein
MIRTFKSNEAVKFVKIDNTEETKTLVRYYLEKHVSYVIRYLCPEWARSEGSRSPRSYIKEALDNMDSKPGGWVRVRTNKRGVRDIDFLQTWPDESSDFFQDHDEVTNEKDV